MAGRPLLADGQSAVFSPFSVPSYMLPFWKSLADRGDAQAVPRRAGRVPARRGCWACASAARSLTGVVFAFGTFFVVWLAWPLASVYAFIAVGRWR